MLVVCHSLDCCSWALALTLLHKQGRGDSEVCAGSVVCNEGRCVGENVCEVCVGSVVCNEGRCVGENVCEEVCVGSAVCNEGRLHVCREWCL